jgi:hypothetical protein
MKFAINTSEPKLWNNLLEHFPIYKSRVISRLANNPLLFTPCYKLVDDLPLEIGLLFLPDSIYFMYCLNQQPHANLVDDSLAWEEKMVQDLRREGGGGGGG